MNIETKNNIKKLAKKFKHKIEYKKEIMILKNEISLQETDKYKITISYNINENLPHTLKVEKNIFTM